MPGHKPRLRRAVRAFARLPLADKLAVARAASIAVAVEAGLRIAPLPRLANVVGVRLDRSARPVASDYGLPESLSARERRDVEAALTVFRAWPSAGPCLRHALVLGRALRSRRPALRIGVSGDAGGALAHAWLEVAGRRIDTGDATAFHPLRAATPRR